MFVNMLLFSLKFYGRKNDFTFDFSFAAFLSCEYLSYKLVKNKQIYRCSKVISCASFIRCNMTGRTITVFEIMLTKSTVCSPFLRLLFSFELKITLSFETKFQHPIVDCDEGCCRVHNIIFFI